MGKKEDTYIQDGLIFWLDGIDKGNDPIAWTDLASGVVFPWADGVTPLSNRVLFSTNHAMLKGDKYIDWPYRTSHLEIVADAWNGMMVFDNRGGQMALGKYYDYFMYGHSRAGGYLKTHTGLSTYSINNNAVWDNAEPQTQVSGNSWVSGGDGITIGSRGNIMKYVGSIYCVRAYNRQLSEEEVQHNFKVDKKRFNIIV